MILANGCLPYSSALLRAKKMSLDGDLDVVRIELSLYPGDLLPKIFRRLVCVGDIIHKFLEYRLKFCAG